MSPNKGSFVFKHLCKYCNALNTKVYCFQASMSILYCSRHKGLLFLSIFVNIVLFSIQRYFVLFICVNIVLFSSICVNIVLFSTHKEVMTSNDVREECLECHMTSNDVREEGYITMMMGRCVNKPDQTEPVACYENTLISNFTQLCK